MLNFFIYSRFFQKKTLFESNLITAKAELQQAIAIQNSSTQLAAEIEWLAEHEPKPSVYQTVQTQLQQFADKEAQNVGLTTRTEFLPTDTSGTHYHRAQIQVKLTGQEQALYRWLHVVNDPASFRTALQIRLSPNSQDDTLIDCTATLAQWFKPADTDL